MIRTVLVEDEPLLAGLLAESLMGSEANVSAVCHSGKEALTRINPQEIDVAVIDIDLGPGPDGVDVARQWRQTHPGLGLVFMTNVVEPGALLLGGGLAYLPKRRATSVASLLACIRAASAGEVMVDASITASLPKSSATLDELTAHQQRILAAVATGASNRKIAADLGIPVKSVENATALALRNLGIDGTDVEVNVRVMAALTYLRLVSEA